MRFILPLSPLALVLIAPTLISIIPVFRVSAAHFHVSQRIAGSTEWFMESPLKSPMESPLYGGPAVVPSRLSECEVIAAELPAGLCQSPFWAVLMQSPSASSISFTRHARYAWGHS
jgi:hypothetical protein